MWSDQDVTMVIKDSKDNSSSSINSIKFCRKTSDYLCYDLSFKVLRQKRNCYKTLCFTNICLM